MIIYVNGQMVETDLTSVNYHEAVMLAFGKPMMLLQTVTYFARIDENTTRSGELIPWQDRVELIEGMSIDVGYTGNA